MGLAIANNAFGLDLPPTNDSVVGSNCLRSRNTTADAKSCLFAFGQIGLLRVEIAASKSFSCYGDE